MVKAIHVLSANLGKSWNKQPQYKGIYTRLLSGQTGKQSISVGLNCLQVKTGDQRSPVVRSSSSIVKSVQSSPEGQRIPR